MGSGRPPWAAGELAIAQSAVGVRERQLDIVSYARKAIPITAIYTQAIFKTHQGSQVYALAKIPDYP